MNPMTAPPISRAYSQTGVAEWVNRNSGDTVQWSDTHDAYLRYNPAAQSWSQWGPTRQGSFVWHVLSGQGDVAQARRSTVDFWVHLLIGTMIFAWAASAGMAGAGAVVLVFFICTGSLMSWMHHRHPMLYTATALVGWFGAYRELRD